MAIGRPQMEEQIEGFENGGGAGDTDPFGGGIDFGGINKDLTSLYETDFEKYQSRLEPYTFQQKPLSIFDVATELGAAILATPKTGNVFEGIGTGFANISKRIRANQAENDKARQQVAMTAANLAMQSEQKAQDYLQKYSLELLKQMNDPGDLIKIEFDEFIPQVDASGNPMLDEKGEVILVPSGNRKIGSFRNNAANRAVIDDLLDNRNGVEVESALVNVGGEDVGAKEYVKANIAREKIIMEEARGAAGVRDQVSYARSIARRLGPEGYGPQEAFTLPIRKILVGVGLGGMVDDQKVGDQILMNQLGIGFAMAIVGQTKGAISNREMEMFLAASPVLTSSYDGFMKQLEYLDRIAERSEKFAIDYANKAAELEDSGISERKIKRKLDLFEAEWRGKNPLFQEDEFNELAALSRGDKEALEAGGYEVDENFRVQDSIQQYGAIQGAKSLEGGVAPVATAKPTSLDEDAVDLARRIAQSDMPREEKVEKLRSMMAGGLKIPPDIIQNLQLDQTTE